MSELITSRITAHATRLGLPHLAENLALLVERAEADNMGSASSSTPSSARNWAYARDAGSAPP